MAYGHSVWVNRVDVLNGEEYRETPVRRIVPGWRKDALRLHTIGASRRLQVMDFLVNRKITEFDTYVGLDSIGPSTPTYFSNRPMEFDPIMFNAFAVTVNGISPLVLLSVSS